MRARARACACVRLYRGFPIKVEVTLPILLLFCLFLVIFLSIGLHPLMMNYPEFFFFSHLFPFLSPVFGLSRCVSPFQSEGPTA